MFVFLCLKEVKQCSDVTMLDSLYCYGKQIRPVGKGGARGGPPHSLSMVQKCIKWSTILDMFCFSHNFEWNINAVNTWKSTLSPKKHTKRFTFPQKACKNVHFLPEITQKKSMFAGKAPPKSKPGKTAACREKKWHPYIHILGCTWSLDHRIYHCPHSNFFLLIK